MDDLVVDHELPPSIVDDQSPNTAPPLRKRAINLAIQAPLIHNSKTLLDIPTLSHTDQSAIITHIQDTILLEHRTQHTLHHDRVPGVTDKGALLM